MKFITFADVHISAINPVSRKGDYLGDIVSKLRQIGEVGKKIKADFYLMAGDLFNLKAPMRNPHELNAILIDVFKEFGAPIYSTEGNHDLQNDSYKNFQKQPLSVLYASGVLRQLRDEIVESKGMRVRLRSFPFSENPDLTSMTKKSDGCFSVAVLHLYSSPRGGIFKSNKVFSYGEIAQIGDDIFVMGHHHMDQGITSMRVGERTVYFVNVGAVSRGSMIEDNIMRMPKIGYISIGKKDGKIDIVAKSVRLNVRPASEVFDLDERDKERQRMDEAELFVEKLRMESENQDMHSTLDSELSSMNLDKAVLESVFHYLNEADIALKRIDA